MEPEQTPDQEQQQSRFSNPTTSSPERDNTGCWIAGILGCGCLFILLVSALITAILYFVINPQGDLARGDLFGASHSDSKQPKLHAELTPVAIPDSFWRRVEPLAVTQQKDEAERTAFSNKVQELFTQEDFAGLEALAAQLRESHAVFYSGESRLSEFYTAIYALQEKQGFDTFYRMLFRWHEKYMRSVTPSVAVMRMARENAWLWRGSKSLRETKRANMSKFKEGLQFAEQRMRGVDEMEHNDPAYYYEGLIIGRGLSYPRRKERALVDASFETDPLYFPSYSAYAIYLLPRWYGDSGDDPAAFAQETYQRVLEKTADETAALKAYAWIVYRVATYGDMDTKTFFNKYPFSWPMIEKGFVAWDAQTPLNSETMNAFAWLAVAAGDQQTAARLFGIIGDNYNANVWYKRQNFDDARSRVLPEQAGHGSFSVSGSASTR